LREIGDKQLLDYHHYVHLWSGDNWRAKPKELTIAECEEFHDLVATEMESRGFEHLTPIHVPPKRVIKECILSGATCIGSECAFRDQFGCFFPKMLAEMKEILHPSGKPLQESVELILEKEALRKIRREVYYQ